MGRSTGRRGGGKICRRAAVVLCLCAGLAIAVHPTAVRAAGPLYPLYYVMEMPPVLTGFEMDETQEKHTLYTGVLRGTLGGLPVQKATLILRPGASAGAGGGEFSLQTVAGAVKNGLVLMTTDKKQTSLWFSGIYLGARLAFRVAGPANNIAGATYAGKGLADTSFADHGNYLAAVTQGVASLTPVARAEAVAAADRNLGLVTGYREETGTP
jgi:hypothetical protein